MPPASAMRTPAIGAREVVGIRIGGSAPPTEVSALLVGRRLDTRNLHDFVAPESLAAAEGGMAFVFRYGVVVFLGVPAQDQAKILAELADHVVEPATTAETETAEIRIRPSGEELVDASGCIILRDASVERLLLTATVLARSVVLATDEARISDAFDRIEPLVTGLRTQGRATLPIRRVMQHIGDVLATRHRMVGRAQISEKPDILWDHPDLERLYTRLEAEYELTERARAIDRKLETIGDAADVLLDIVQDKRSVRLELAIIGLITFEIAFALYEKLIL